MPNTERDLSAVEIAKLEGQMMQGFAELGGKLDTLISRQEAAEASRSEDRTLAQSRHDDHETRIRVLESHGTSDHESRIDELEARKTIAPWQLWTAVASIVTVAGIIIGAVTNIIK